MKWPALQRVVSMLSVTPDLRPFEIEMNGYRIGEWSPFFAQDFEPGGVEWRVQDQEAPDRDGVMFGRDYANPNPVVLSLVSMADTTRQVREDLRELAAAWRWTERRDTPGDYTYIAWESAGEVAVMYGRPRKFVPEISGGALHQGGVVAALEFQPLSPLIFTGRVESHSLLIRPLDPPGLLFPAESPFLFQGGGQPRQGQLTVSGYEPTPFEVHVKWPISDPKVWSTVGGWEIQVTGHVAYDQTLIVDTLANTARVGGSSVAHRLTRRSNLNARLKPGVQEFLFSGRDETQTATATIRWMNAHTGY